MDWDLLWYDDSRVRTDLEKVERAAARFEQKFGKPAAVCFVHPATSSLEHLQKTAFRSLGINVYVAQGRVPAPYHFRVGANGKTGGRSVKQKGQHRG